MMTYHYLLGYMTETKYGTQQIHKSIFANDKQILTSEDVEEVEEFLRENWDVEKVILFSFSKLDGELKKCTRLKN